MTKMLEEILSQEQVLKDTYECNLNPIKDIVKLIKKKKIKYFEMVARGSSKNACEIFKYILETNSNYRVSFVYPSTFTKYKGKASKESCYIAVSQGGKGVDLRMVIEEANKAKALTIGVTNEENSPLNEVCNKNLYLKVNKELSMAATKTFTSEMVVLAMLASSLCGQKLSIYKDIPSLITKIDQKKIESFAKEFKKIKNLFVLTRGKLLGVGKEVCCKFQETCFINANCFATSDFMHGPFALVDENFSAFVLVPNDETKDDVLNMIKKINENKGKVFAIHSEDTKLTCYKNFVLPKVNKDVYPFLMTFVIQLIAANLSELLGNDPDKSRNLNKYTKTI